MVNFVKCATINKQTSDFCLGEKQSCYSLSAQLSPGLSSSLAHSSENTIERPEAESPTIPICRALYSLLHFPHLQSCEKGRVGFLSF